MNNRQNGRRRGRGGQQARNGQPGGPDRGNRLDNRARGNAAQLLEKYKNLARDAQMQGDRVNTEYYLQFADHYFRVLNENRARFEEQRPRQSDYRDEFGGEEDGGDANPQRFQGRDEQAGEEGWDEGEQPQAEQREPRRERQARQSDDHGDGPREGRRERGRRNANSSANANSNGNGHTNGNGFSAPDFLNEPITPRFEFSSDGESEAEEQPQPVEAAAVQEEEAAPKRRRTRRPRGEGTPAEA
jgi:hypothetical protein